MKQTKLYYKEMSSPLGPITMFAEDREVVRIEFGTFEQVKTKIAPWLKRYFNNPNFIEGHELIEAATNQFNEYFLNERKQFSIPYKLYGTPFQQSVWNATEQRIPYGKTKSYKQIAEIIDHVKAVRAIGGALNKNPCSIIVPCHRVIGSSGKLVGYGGGLDKKTYLLNFEQQS